MVLPQQMTVQQAMERALALAAKAAAAGEVPVGAVVLDGGGRVLAMARNHVEGRHDASAHAELLAMRQAAGQHGLTRLEGCTLVVTLEPCPMCAAAMSHFRIRRLVYAAYDPKGGGVDHGPRLFHRKGCLHRPDEVVSGMRERDAAVLLRGFFRALRDTEERHAAGGQPGGKPGRGPSAQQGAQHTGNDDTAEHGGQE